MRSRRREFGRKEVIYLALPVEPPRLDMDDGRFTSKVQPRLTLAEHFINVHSQPRAGRLSTGGWESSAMMTRWSKATQMVLATDNPRARASEAPPVPDHPRDIAIELTGIVSCEAREL